MIGVLSGVVWGDFTMLICIRFLIMFYLCMLCCLCIVNVYCFGAPYVRGEKKYINLITIKIYISKSSLAFVIFLLRVLSVFCYFNFSFYWFQWGNVFLPYLVCFPSDLEIKSSLPKWPLFYGQKKIKHILGCRVERLLVSSKKA